MRCRNWYNAIFLLVLGQFILLGAEGQVSLFFNEAKARTAPGLLRFITDTSKNRTLERFRQVETQLLDFPEHNFNISYRNKMAWLLLDLGKLDQQEKPAYLMIRNPHINYLNLWLLKDGQVVKAFTPTGDRTVFSTRPMRYADFLFPLPADSLSRFQVLLLADKRNELIHLPVYLLTENGLIQYTRTKNWTAGLFIGISLFLFLFNIFLFINLREKLYVFYGLYILLAFLYIFSDMGYTFMYFFPNNPLLSDFTRPMSIAFATPVYLLFGMSLLQTRNHWPLLYRFVSRVLLGYTALLIASLLLARDTGPIRVVLSGLSYFALNLLMGLNILVAWKSWRKGVPYAIYLIISSVLLIVLVFLFSLYLSGYLSDTPVNRNLMRIAITSEISILTLVLAHRFKRYKLDSEQLLRRINDQQEQIFRSVTDYQEKEMQRLSSLLHDSVGARLSALRFNLEAKGKDDLPVAIGEIGEIANEVRRFSHNWSPVLLQERGLRRSLEDFINGINSGNRLFIQFEMIGSLEKASFRYELIIYNIVQELVHNILKHAEASEAIVQVLLEEKVVSIYVEDNGRGFDPAAAPEGLGLSQIKKWVTFVNGRLLLDSAPGKGTRVSIEFITIPDEANVNDLTG